MCHNNKQHRYCMFTSEKGSFSKHTLNDGIVIIGLSPRKRIVDPLLLWVLVMKILKVSNNYYTLQHNSHEGKKPSTTWTRPSGRPRRTWLNHIQDADARPLSTICRSEVARGHGGAQRSVRTPRWWWLYTAFPFRKRPPCCTFLILTALLL